MSTVGETEHTVPAPKLGHAHGTAANPGSQHAHLQLHLACGIDAAAVDAHRALDEGLEGLSRRARVYRRAEERLDVCEALELAPTPLQSRDVDVHIGQVRVALSVLLAGDGSGGAGGEVGRRGRGLRHLERGLGGQRGGRLRVSRRQGGRGRRRVETFDRGRRRRARDGARPALGGTEEIVPRAAEDVPP
ncbi:hypothetical protein A1Q2_04461 [Trichosporon asahii var. asahii CBS 8904]|nr:hypothetical protein A1Q2_04461 [Trichosporon asahii var. asahii CBS 8904]